MIIACFVPNVSCPSKFIMNTYSRLAECIVWFDIWAGLCTKMLNRTILLCTNHEHRAIITWPRIIYFFYGIYNVTTFFQRQARRKCLLAADHRMCACVFIYGTLNGLWVAMAWVGYNTASFDCDKTYLGCHASIFIGHFKLDSHAPAGQRNEDKDFVGALPPWRTEHILNNRMDGWHEAEWMKIVTKWKEVFNVVLLYIQIKINGNTALEPHIGGAVVGCSFTCLVVWMEFFFYSSLTLTL